MKQPCIVFVFFFTMTLLQRPSFSQEYKGAVGGRFGYGIGLSGVYYIQNGHGFEFLLRYGYHGLILNKPGANFQLLYEKHWELGRSSWTGYIGGGPSFGFGKKNSLSKQTYFAVGISPIFGFDYTAQRLKIPLVFSLDYKPTFNTDFPIKSSLKTTFDFSYYEVALSVRIGIGRGK